MQAFIERGVKAVKMDDIATKLTISKRTLYEIYTDKEQLLFEGIKKYDKSKRLKLQQYAAQGHSVIDIILEAYRMKIKEIRMVNPTFYIDIMKYPRVEQFIRENMFDAIGQYVMNNSLLQRYSVEEMFSNYFLVSLRGLCTAEGIRVVDAAVL